LSTLHTSHFSPYPTLQGYRLVPAWKSAESPKLPSKIMKPYRALEKVAPAGKTAAD
jgi:hypothetical protein